MKKSELEITFLKLLDILTPDLPKPECEYRFFPERRWRFDFAFPNKRIAVECEGGIWVRGRHLRGAGFEKDVEKYNAATLLGWRVYRVTTSMLREDPHSFLDMLKEAIEQCD